MSNHEQIFSNIIKNRLWGNNESVSGYASTKQFTKDFYVPFIKDFIIKNSIGSVADLGCGDFNFGGLIYDDIKNIKYIGYDCCEFLIQENKQNFSKYEFVYLDLIRELDRIKEADLIIAKDLFQHWNNLEVDTFLKTLIKNKKFNYLLMTYTWNIENLKFNDIETGQFKPMSINDFPLNQFNPTLIKRWGDLGKYYELNGDWFPYIMETSLITK